MDFVSTRTHDSRKALAKVLPRPLAAPVTPTTLFSILKEAKVFTDGPAFDIYEGSGRTSESQRDSLPL